MQIIEGLKENTAIKVGDNYVVQLQSGYNRQTFIVNDVETTSKQVLVGDLNSIYYQKPSTRVLI